MTKYADEEFADFEVLPPSDNVTEPKALTPLDILRDLMLTAESESVRVSAAKGLAEYEHLKRQPETSEGQRVNFNVTMTEAVKPFSLAKKK